jgi:acetate kinase
MAGVVGVLNAGSSSIKFEVFDALDNGLGRRYDGLIEGIGTAPRFVARNPQGETLHETRWEENGGGHAAALEQLGGWLIPQLQGAELLGVGHRVVHGGPDFAAPVVIDDAVLAALESLIPLAPLHQPHNLAGIKAAMELLPGVPNVACFDTAFHRTQPGVADMFALPRSFYDEGVRRYGFHGLSYEYIAQAIPSVAPELAGGRVVVAHLGNGASMCAMIDGRGVASTMSFTALDGLPMGTRSGDLDPGVLLYLMQAKGMDAKAIEDLLYKRSGLLGLSGLSNDMRVLEESDNDAATDAIDYFVYRIGRELGSLAAAMQGIDGLIFTAGIGENSRTVRALVCRSAHWLGLAFDEAANERNGPRISAAGSQLAAYVIPTDEELMIAQHTLAALR